MRRLILLFVLPLLGLESVAYEGKRALFRVKAEKENKLDNLQRELTLRNCDILKVNQHRGHLDAVCGSDLNHEAAEVVLHDLDAWITAERRDILTAHRRRRRSASSELDFTSFHSFGEIEAYLQHLARSYPGFVRLESVGTTHENRSIYLLHIGHTQNRIEKKAMFIDGGIHAREWGSVSSVAYIIKELVNLFNNTENMQSDVRSQVNYYIMPVVNPDGYEYTRTGNRMWRKNRSPPPEGSSCFGVDLNRNWNVSGFGVGASDDPCSEIYKGTHPDSEPEVKAAKKALSSFPDVRQYLGFHSYGSYILTPFGYTKDLPKDNDRIMKVGHSMREAVLKVNGRNYTVGSPAHIFYAAGGASDDFSKLNGIPTSMTIELPEVEGAGFLLPQEKIIEIGREAWAALRPAVAHIVEHEDHDVSDSLYVVRTEATT